MNIFLYETKTQKKSFFLWNAGLLALLIVFMGAFYDVFMQSREVVQQALGNFPPVFAAMFGVKLDTIFSYAGYYQFIYIYIGVVGAIMASLFAVSAFSREKRAKCVDFLLTKPVSRGRIFRMKLLSCLALLAMTNIFYVAASVIAYRVNGGGASDTGTIVLASLSLFFTQLVFLSIGAAYAVFARKVRSVSGVATSIGFAGFIMMALYSVIKEEFLRYVSPLGYFNPNAVFETGGYEAKYVVTAIVVALCCIAAAYLKYTKSDTQVL